MSSAAAAPRDANHLPSPGEPTAVGSLDLSDLPIIDVHMHPPAEGTHGQENEKWTDSFVDALMPAEDYPGKPEHRARVTESFRRHFYNNPKEVGLRDYVARVYGVEATAAGVDSVAAEHVGNDFTEYIRSIMDREKISGILLQSADTEPKRPASLIPDERFRWTYHATHFLDPRWAQEQGLTNLGEVVAAIHDIQEECVGNECVGFKSSMAYFRPLQVDNVTTDQATGAFERLRSANAIPEFVSDVTGGLTTYAEEENRQDLKSYQDYIFKTICVKAGELRAKIIIHTAVALHPSLRFDYNSPLDLYYFFQDDDVRRAETEFVLIHTGYPYHHHMAALLSQFPNVYTDLSFYSSCPGTLEEVLRTLLALAPSEKIMHGTDWSDPEVWGYSAFNLRRVLARVLNDYRYTYGWSQEVCEVMARNVMYENAKRVYGFAD